MTGPGSGAIVERMIEGIEDAEFTIPRNIVVDISVTGTPTGAADGSTSVVIEALTVEE